MKTLSNVTYILTVILKDSTIKLILIRPNQNLNNSLRRCGIPFSKIDLRATIDGWNIDYNFDSKLCVVIDDDNIVLKLSNRDLERDGHVILTYISGETAFKHLDNWINADIAFVDYHMPGMLGDAVLNKIKLFTKIPKLFLRSSNWNIATPIGIESWPKPDKLKAA